MTLDSQGNVIGVGDEVAFAAVVYRRAELRVGKIEAVDHTRGRDAVQVFNPVAHRREWRNPQHLVKTA